MHPGRCVSLFMLLALTALVPQASAQRVSVQGLVRDSVTGRPLDGAQLVFEPAGLTALSDVDGTFGLAGMPAGVQRLRVLRLGYAPWEGEVSISPTSGPLAIAMRPAATEVAGITVVGSGEGSLARIPGAAALIDQRQLEAARPLSGNEVLKLVPGVHVQEEESMGLRANIGIRGLDPDRSRTVLVLEDGVPVALGPYGEPEMYYTPPIERMERVEIIKGSGSIVFGPQTVGGVVNYVTGDPPARPAGRLRLLGGSGTFAEGYLSYGGTWDQAGFRGGLLRRQAQDIRGLWFDQTDFTGKVSLGLSASSTAGVKVGVYDERSNSTYVGLTDSIFRADPTFYPGANDLLAIRRYSSSLSFERAFAEGISLKATAYGYQTTRNWRRQDYGYTASGSGYVWRNSTGNRNRSFEVLGIEPRLTAEWRGGTLEAGVRAHLERALDLQINGATATSSSGVIRDEEERGGRALAAFVQHRTQAGTRLRVTPGVRFEYFDYDRHLLRTRVRRGVLDAQGQVVGATLLPEDVDLKSGDDLAAVIPGVGVSWLASGRTTLFAGAHRGFAPPRIKDALIYDDEVLPPGQQPGNLVSLQLDAEKSWNVELGTRTRPLPGIQLAATVFLLDFSNQIVTPSLSAGSVAQAVLANQGATRHRGFEAALGADWGLMAGLGFSLRTDLSYTTVDAVFSRDRFLLVGSDTVNIRGNRLPYAPRYTLVVGSSLEMPGGAALRLDCVRVGEQFADNFETRTASANGRVGVIPAHMVWNAAGTLEALHSHARLMVTVKNLFDRVYIASRRPEGIKPGLLRQVNLGVDWRF